MRHLTHTRFWLLPLAFALGACTAILPPDQSDDDVERCDNTSECAESDDTRLTAVCYIDEELTQGAPGVCLMEYAEISCDYEAFQNTPEENRADWMNVAFDAAANTPAYAGCDADKRGSNGCQARSAGNGDPCDAGLEQEDIGGFIYCMDPANEPQVLPATNDRAGEDVQHAFCAAMFGCDNAFVCNNGTGKCVPCDPAKGPDEDGACQQFWVNGAPALAYEGSTCNDQGNIEPVDIQVGTPNQDPIVQG